METLNDKFCKVTGLTWDLNQYITSLKAIGMTDEQISEKILWLVPDGTMLDDPEYRKAVFTKELLSDETLAELGIDENAKFSPDEESEEDEHEYVDLGLPSGTLWATENIKDDNGNELYFAWGETQGYTAEQVGKDKNFTWKIENNDYAFGPIDWNDKTNRGMKKYNNTDGLTVLEPKDDAAIINWCKGWKMPTKEQFQELIDNTEHEWTKVDGIQGAKLTSNVEGYTDRFLFFPAVGYAVNGVVYSVGDSGYCWSASVGGDGISDARRFYSNEDFSIVYYSARNVGNPVRPVRVK